MSMNTVNLLFWLILKQNISTEQSVGLKLVLKYISFMKLDPSWFFQISYVDKPQNPSLQCNDKLIFNMIL